jgi:excisionase family DNA binding protein
METPDNAPSTVQKLMHSRHESKDILSISLRTLDRLIEEKLLSVKRVGRKVLISRRELERFAAK